MCSACRTWRAAWAGWSRMSSSRQNSRRRGRMSFNRRRFVQGLGLSLTGIPFQLKAQSDPIRLGLMTVKTGPLASGGIDMERALVMYLKERGNKMAGRAVELIVADTAGVPATARTKTQELVEKNKVHCLIGPLAAFEALAIDDYIRQV